MRFLTANDQQGQHPPSWYAATAHTFPDHPRLEGQTRADIAIVGGGYAGLSAALHLAEAGLDVALVEAHRLGWGASGRNGGQLSYGPRIDIRKYEAMLGREDAAKVWAISTEATDLVRRLIARHAIDCDLRPGHLEAFCHAGEVAEADAYAAHIGQHYGHHGLQVLGRDEIRARVRSPLYEGGMADSGGGHLHPLNYALGLGRAARAAGARLHEHSRVTRLGDGFVETETGRIDADRVIVAANGYLDGLDRGGAARSAPLNNFIIATEPLGDRAPIPGDECVCDTKFVLNYYRMSADGRLLFGGGETTGGRFPADIKGFVRRPLARVFPHLADVRIDYGWGGTLAITPNRTPLFHQEGRRLLIGGWSGAGVHMATMGGMIAAEAVRGTLARWDVLARVPSPAFPGGSALRPALLALALGWYRLRDRL